jgi:predicted DNA-binding WGR domain protein
VKIGDIEVKLGGKPITSLATDEFGSCASAGASAMKSISVSMAEAEAAFTKFSTGYAGGLLPGLSMHGRTSAELWELFGPRVRDTAGKLIYGWRGENRTTRNAEYTVTVTLMERKTTGVSAPEEEYNVVATWGKLGGTLQRQTKQITTNKTSALTTAAEVVREKKSHQYVEVEEYKDSGEEDGWPDVDPDDDLVAEPESVRLEPPMLDCSCFHAAEEYDQALWVDPEPADLTIAPKLMEPRYGLQMFSRNIRDVRGARYVVVVDSSCSGGYAHVRAYGPASPARVEDVFLKALNFRTSRTFDFALVVEVLGDQFWVIDAMRLEGIDLTEKGWLDRHQALAAGIDKVLDRSAKLPGGARIYDPDVTVENIREEYLSNGDHLQFELHGFDDKLGFAGGWELPRL